MIFFLQTYIIDKIQKIVPNAQFIAEEMEDQGSILADELFIIDPIDGTTNFNHNIGYCSVSIAWYRKGVPFFGVVYWPDCNELYEAKLGDGAYLNNKSICVSLNHLQESVVIFGTSPYNLEKSSDTFARVAAIFDKCQDVRRFGSAALDICQVACGRAGIYFEASLSLWDYAAARLILSEACGVVIDYEGNPIGVNTDKTSIVVGNPEIIKECGLFGSDMQ